MDESDNTECCFSFEKYCFLKPSLYAISGALTIALSGLSFLSLLQRTAIVPCLVICSLVLTTSVRSVLAKSNVDKAMPSVIATIYLYHASHPKNAKELTARVSAEGIRIDDNKAAISFIQSLQHDKVWLVNNRKSIYQEFALKDVVLDDLAFNSDSNKHALSETDSTGLFATQPCEGLDKEFVAYEQWRGLWVSRWNCRKHKLHDRTQLYSVEYQLVIQEKTYNQWVSELRNIRRVDAGKFNWLPIKGYKKVGLGQWFGIGPSLSKYRGDDYQQ